MLGKFVALLALGVVFILMLVAEIVLRSLLALTVWRGAFRTYDWRGEIIVLKNWFDEVRGCWSLS